MYLIFYSVKCKYSRKIIDIIEKIGEKNNFNYVSVDKKNGKRNPLVKKYKVEEVPTLIVNNRYYIGKDAFSWVEGKIKNINHQISSQHTRMNKNPSNVLSGYIPDMNSQQLGVDSSVENFDGTGSYASLTGFQKIETPKEDENFDRGDFILKDDLITGHTDIIDDKKTDKMTQMEQQFNRVKLEREKQDAFYKKAQPRY